MKGESGVVECAFVESSVTDAAYFSTPLELGVNYMSLKCACLLHALVLLATIFLQSADEWTGEEPRPSQVECF